MKRQANLLVVDDDAAMRQMLAALFREDGVEVTEAGSTEDALARCRDDEFDVVLSDIRMAGKSGIELTAELGRIRPQTPVVLMTAFGSIDSAIDAMRSGAFDYITKPFEPEEVQMTVQRALERRALEEENRRLRRAVDQTSSFGDLIGESPSMREIFALIRKIARGRSNVLITGESGTGKEVVARTIHYSGPRADEPFIPLNCTAIPEGLLESELFGHVRGAFTGANASKTGLFEKADGGTLFLDEIGDMGLVLQGKLLRVLQDREIRPVGSTRSVKVDVRILAATNRDLHDEIQAGNFREDLFYRLNVIPIHVPPLRERPEDIEPLVSFFLKRHDDGQRPTLTRAAIERLRGQEWRGNARELENVIERAVALSENSVIDEADLPFLDGRAPEEEPILGRALAQQMTLRELEELYTDRVLELTGGNKMQAARILGIDRKTIYRRKDREARERGQRQAGAAEVRDLAAGGEAEVA